jgi:receptor protein-tyrosine kinase
MNLLPAGETQEVSAVLVRRCGLTEEDVNRIGGAQQQLKVHFIEAALRLGYVTQADIDAALATLTADSASARAEPKAELVLAHNSFDPHSERIRALRTELLLRRDETAESNVVAILSPCAREGRSRLAAELAISFSQLGQPTLLVDADLRHSRQHELFAADNDRGLVQALVSNDPPHVQSVSGLPNLHLLTAGPRPANPQELLSDGHFGELLGGWMRRYQHVVLDTAPVSDFADGLAVATVAGRVLALSRAKLTPFRATQQMLRRLSTTHARILGAVVNHF